MEVKFTRAWRQRLVKEVHLRLEGRLDELVYISIVQENSAVFVSAEKDMHR
jgi:hypothetical protein